MTLLETTVRQRHAAAMLIHQLASGIEALNDLPQEVAMENAEGLSQCFRRLGDFLIRLHDIEIKKNELYRSHQ